METDISPINKRRRLSDDVLTQLKDLIIQKKIKPGEKLPTEKALSDLFQVGRPSIREATRTLGFMGFLDIRQGDGVYVKKEPDIDFYLNLLQESFELFLSVNEQTFLHLLEVRSILEIQTASNAARYADEDDLRELKRVLVKLEECLEDVNAYSELDLEFHNIIARASHNIILYHLMNLIYSLIRRLHHEFINAPEIIELFHPHHKNLFEAIKNRSEEKASQTMKEHITEAEKFFRKAISGGPSKK